MFVDTTDIFLAQAELERFVLFQGVIIKSLETALKNTDELICGELVLLTFHVLKINHM